MHLARSAARVGGGPGRVLLSAELLIAIALLVGAALGAVLGALVASGLARRAAAALAVQMRATDAAHAEAERATLLERCRAQAGEIEALRAQLAASVAGQRQGSDELARARESLVRIETELEQERAQAAEKLAFLETARTTLAAQFQALASEILEEKSQRFSAQHKSELDLLLKPLGEKLQSFEKKVEETYVNEAKERFSLAEEVRKLQAANLQISQEAVNLTRALKGEAKTRGNWGEVILERVLERSGLVKGREYETQVTLEGDAGRLRPDVVVRLPENKHIVIDSKVSLVAYDRYYAAPDEVAREAALAEHVASMRRHIDDLAAKNYQGRDTLNAPDFVAMFVPIEPAFYLAAQCDDALYLDAFEKRVVIVTPATLLAMLSTVSTLWRRELQTQNALEIAKRSGDLYDKFVGFVEALQEIGSRLASAQDAYERAVGRLSAGRGNLVRKVEELKRLGARAEKSLPADLLARAGAGGTEGATEGATEGGTEDGGDGSSEPVGEIARAPLPGASTRP